MTNSDFTNSTTGDFSNLASESPHSSVQRVGLILGPVLFAVLLVFKPFDLQPGGNETLATFAWMLSWWITEAVPLAVTALLPMVLLSLTGVMSLDESTKPYANKIVYLFFGGFVLALGLEEHGLHRRIALKIIGLTGLSPERLILGFLLATAAISMWISNTATTAMMLPMALSVLALINAPSEPTDSESDGRAKRNFSTSLILIIAHASTIGGLGTVVGTPPNLVARGFLENQYGVEIPFFTWMLWALPIVVVLLATLYILFVYVFFPIRGLQLDKASEVFDAERKKLGPMDFPKWMMLGVFGMTVFLWMFRDLIDNWIPWFKLSDEIIAIMAAIAIFSIPTDWKQYKPLLGWEATKRLQWGILLLFGGGLCLAEAFERTGVLWSLADQFQKIGQGHILLTMILLTALTLYASEVMSNVALVNVIIPIICGIAVATGVAPVEFAFPATLAASCAFMLPMATPPNAIVFSSGQLTVRQMVGVGFWLNLISLIAILALAKPLMTLFSL